MVEFHAKGDAVAIDPKAGETAATIHSVQLLRAIAATLVVLFHAQVSFATDVSRPSFSSESYLFAFGAVGVHVFFVISGFIMVITSWTRGRYDAAAFFRRRLTRIYPIYWLCAICYLAVHALIAKPYQLSSEQIGGALVLWPGLSSLIIGPAWTLTFEMYFYLCFGLAMLLGLDRGLIALGTLFGAAIAVGAWLQPGEGVAFVITNSLLLEFLAGAAIGYLSLRGAIPSSFGPAITGAAIVLFGAGLWYGYDRAPSAVVWGVPSALLVLGLIAWERRNGASYWVRKAGKLGDSSYVLYLIHVLVVSLALEIAGGFDGANSLEPAAAALIITPLAVVLAHGIHSAIEKPLLRLLNRSRPPIPRSETEHRKRTKP